MEYYYRNLFKEKLKSLYGFDYEKAERISLSESSNLIKEGEKNNIKKLENKIENKIDKNINNGGRNVFSVGKGLLTIASVVLRVVNISFLPITCIVGSYISFTNIEIDCLKMIKIFEDAYTPLKFETLNNYIETVTCAIEYLNIIGQKLKQKIDEENKEIEEEEKKITNLK